MTDLYRIAREVTDSIMAPVTLRPGKRYVHPEDGEIEITSGCYRAYGRVSNFWYWTVIATGEKKHGYGANWPERAQDVSS